MKNALALLIGLILVIFACKPTNEKKEVTVPPGTAPFTITIEEDHTRPFLPALHSFVLATSNDYWLMFAGRTNGMHDFGGDHYEEKSFPHVDFNDSLFVCNTTECRSLPVSVIPMPYQDMFKATNLQHLQIGNDLYVTGGYGENSIPGSSVLEQYDTYPYMAKIDIMQASEAIWSGDSESLISSMVFGEGEAVRATGGELFQIGAYFYLATGHIYKGIFSVQDTTASLGSQVYLDAVHRFKINDSGTALSISDFTKITDGLPDDTTQFRRRDLPVVPGLKINAQGNLTPSLSLYAGVFTSPDNKIPELVKNANFTNPIYIHSDGTYEVDHSYAQEENIYTCANFVMYDPVAKNLYTNLLGGIGDNTTDIGYTNNVLTIVRPLEQNASYDVSQGNIPTKNIMGAEALFVHSNTSKIAANEDIIDFNRLVSGEKTEVGSFYGGIEAFEDNPGGYGPGKSKASKRVFKVFVTKD